MSFLIVISISFMGIIIGKLIFRKWVNHLTIYCVIWGILIFLYELKLVPYPELIPLAWFFIISAFVSFLLGILTIITAKKLYTQKQLFVQKSDVKLDIFRDNGRTLKYFIYIFSFIGIYAGYQHWTVLINMFGSIPAVFLNAQKIYRMGIAGEIKGIIPYIYISGYVAVFFAGIYTAYKGKFLFLSFFPFIGIVLKEIATVGRAGMLLGLMEFLFSFFLFRNLLKDDSKKRFIFSKKNAIIFISILFIFLIASSSFVRIIRTPGGEGYKGANRKLNQLKDNLIISPSIYVYFSSDLGVLSKYLESKEEITKIGQNTFLPFHALLAKFGVGKRPSDFLRGYKIPLWTNTGTYIRELHADFGIMGVFLGPYLIGILLTWLWFKFYTGNSLIIFAFLVFLNIIVGFSFLVMVSRLMQWFLGLIIIVVCIPAIEKIAVLVRASSSSYEISKE